MTNNPKIDGVSLTIPRDLAESLNHYCACADTPKSREMHQQLNEILNAPAVERQEAKKSQVPVLRAMAANYRNGHSWDFLDGEAVSKAADEITALQSTIARLEARVAELESGRGEPQAFLIQRESCFPNMMGHRSLQFSAPDYPVSDSCRVTPLYAAPPAPVEGLRSALAECIKQRDALKSAPVAVVLPERKDGNGPALSNHRSYNQGWNACLDATAALNGPAK